MFYPANLPWPQIHEYILEVGSERQPSNFCRKALTGISRLIPIDSAILLYLNEISSITKAEAFNIPEQYKKFYIDYFDQINPWEKNRPYQAHILHTDWNEFRNTAFAVDWFFNKNGVISAVGILLRSKCTPGFSDKELAIINIVQSHLTNLFAILDNNHTELLPPDIAPLIQEFRQLTKREAEIAALLCQGISTPGISSKLFISPATVYRHINNTFEKLQVSNRQELIALILGTDNRDSENDRKVTKLLINKRT